MRNDGEYILACIQIVERVSFT